MSSVDACRSSEGSASLVYGNYNQVIVKGDINGPISDTFAWGLSGTANQRDGYFTNLVSGSDINERSRWGLRGQLLWVPTDSLERALPARHRATIPPG